MVLFVLFILTPLTAQVGSQIPKDKPRNITELIYMGMVMSMPVWILVIREIFKHLDFKKKNGVINDIKTDTTDLKTAVKLIAGQVKSQKENCTQTTQRFSNEINKNQDIIISHIEKG